MDRLEQEQRSRPIRDRRSSPKGVSLTYPAHCPHNSRTFAELRVRAGQQGKTKIKIKVKPGIVGLRPPSAALRAAHDGTGNAGILPGHDERRL